MPFNKDTHVLSENYANMNKPSSLNDVKKLSNKGTELDVKGQLSPKGESKNAPVSINKEEDAEHMDLSVVSTKALLAELMKRHASTAVETES